MDKTAPPLPPRHRGYPRREPLRAPTERPEKGQPGRAWSRSVPAGRTFPRQWTRRPGALA